MENSISSDPCARRMRADLGWVGMVVVVVVLWGVLGWWVFGGREGGREERKGMEERVRKVTSAFSEVR